MRWFFVLWVLLCCAFVWGKLCVGLFCRTVLRWGWLDFDGGFSLDVWFWVGYLFGLCGCLLMFCLSFGVGLGLGCFVFSGCLFCGLLLGLFRFLWMRIMVLLVVRWVGFGFGFVGFSG